MNAGSYDDFFSAVRQNDAARVQTLLQRGFDPGAVDESGVAAIFVALNSDAFAVAATLVDWPQSPIDLRNQADESPLMLAALKGDLPLCRLLIEKGADVNKTGWTPLHYAATKAQLAIMRLLLEENAYIDAESPNGSTPLMMAAKYGNPEAVKLLLEAGADPLLKNQLGLSAIDFALQDMRQESAQLIAAFVRGRQPKGSW